jgi:hypothetical protein
MGDRRVGAADRDVEQGPAVEQDAQRARRGEVLRGGRSGAWPVNSSRRTKPSE